MVALDGLAQHFVSATIAAVNNHLMRTDELLIDQRTDFLIGALKALQPRNGPGDVSEVIAGVQSRLDIGGRRWGLRCFRG